MHSKHKIVPFSSGATHSKMAAGEPSAAIGRAQSARPMGELDLAAARTAAGVARRYFDSRAAAGAAAAAAQ